MIEKNPASNTSAGDSLSSNERIRQPIAEMIIPTIIPKTPPIKERKADSAKNWAITAVVLAPIDLRIPISLVLSVTETSIMFIIPMPPTTRDTIATSIIKYLAFLIILPNISARPSVILEDIALLPARS